MPHMKVRHFGLHNNPWIFWIGDIHAGEVFGGGLMGHPENPAAIISVLHGNALAHAAKPIEFVMGQQGHVVGHGLRAAILRCHHVRRAHQLLSEVWR
jgi:hypothetical protein